MGFWRNILKKKEEAETAVQQALTPTRKTLWGRLAQLFRGDSNAPLAAQLEEVLYTSDLGGPTARRLLEVLRRGLGGRAEEALARRLLTQEVLQILPPPAPLIVPDGIRPFVLMMVGVNGVGKTTTIGKLAYHLKEHGLSVQLAAADTFRKAAIEQLQVWGERCGAEVVSQAYGADPGAVAFDAVQAARARGIDCVIIDTAGRLHTKVNLMEELKKIKRVCAKAQPGAPHQTLLVIDATTGQNAIAQAREFHQAVGVSGLIITKLDGSAKGGVVVGIAQELHLPIPFIGVGEGLASLAPFDPQQFAAALFAAEGDGK